MLARLIVRYFCGEESSSLYSFELDSVLEHVAKTGRNVVLIQLDSSRSNPVLGGALIRACHGFFTKVINGHSEVLVIPIIWGIPYINFREDLLNVSLNAFPRFISLSGV